MRLYITEDFFDDEDLIKSTTEPENIVKFVKPLLDIGLSDKFCFELIDDSKILPGSKYSTNRKRFNRN